MSLCLQACGAFGMTLLYGVVPPLMAWQLRARLSTAEGTPAASSKRGQHTEPSWATAWAQGAQGGPFVPGGTPMLAGMLAVALMIFGGHLASDVGVPLDSLAGQLVEVVGSVSAPARGTIMDATLL